MTGRERERERGRGRGRGRERGGPNHSCCRYGYIPLTCDLIMLATLTAISPRHPITCLLIVDERCFSSHEGLSESLSNFTEWE